MGPIAGKRPIERADMRQSGQNAPASNLMSTGRRSLWQRYGMALVSSAIWFGAALTAQLAVNDNGLLMALAVVTVCAWYGGVGPGLLQPTCW